MSFDLCLSRYAKGTVKEHSNFQDIAENVDESGEGVVFFGRSLAREWFMDGDNIESLRKCKKQEEDTMYLVKKEDLLVCLNTLKEALKKKEEVAKAVDEAVGDCTVYGRSDIDGHAAIICARDIMEKHIPKGWRMDMMWWNIPCLRDFFWVFWEQIEKTIDRLDELNKNMDWDKEDLFFFVC